MPGSSAAEMIIVAYSKGQPGPGLKVGHRGGDRAARLEEDTDQHRSVPSPWEVPCEPCSRHSRYWPGTGRRGPTGSPLVSNSGSAHSFRARPGRQALTRGPLQNGTHQGAHARTPAPGVAKGRSWPWSLSARGGWVVGHMSDKNCSRRSSDRRGRPGEPMTYLGAVLFPAVRRAAVQPHQCVLATDTTRHPRP